MNRRRFLKYVGVTAAVIGASALGLDYLVNNPQIPSQQTSQTQIPTSSSLSARSVLTTSSSSAQLASLQGRLFFDYNGNGTQEPEEPAVSNAEVSLVGPVKFGAVTDSAGDYKIQDVPAGSYKLYVQADQRFQYMCTSTEEFRAVTENYDLSLNGLRKMDIGLMEGFLTLPFKKYESRLESYVDLDPGPGIRDWRGGTQTYDGHPGTDFLASAGTEVLASAPGRVLAAADGWPSNPQWTGQDYYRNNGNFVIVDCGDALFVAYHHLKSINVPETFWSSNGPKVRRGQVIGLVDATGVTSAGGTIRIATPHLHLQIWNGTGFMHGRVDALDPFKDLYYGKHGVSAWSNPVSLWTKDNDPQYAVT